MSPPEQMPTTYSTPVLGSVHNAGPPESPLHVFLPGVAYSKRVDNTLVSSMVTARFAPPPDWLYPFVTP